jgi:hypothetical protein
VWAKCLGRVCVLQILAIASQKVICVYLRDSYLEGLSLYHGGIFVRMYVLDALCQRARMLSTRVVTGCIDQKGEKYLYSPHLGRKSLEKTCLNFLRMSLPSV